MNGDTHLIGEILRISRCSESYRKQQLSDIDLPASRHLFISCICQHPGCAQEELASHLRIDKTTVAHHLASLEKGGYIRREAGKADARCRHVFPTEKAMDIYPRIHGAYLSFTDKTLVDFTQQEKETLQALLRKLSGKATALLRDTAGKDG